MKDKWQVIGSVNEAIICEKAKQLSEELASKAASTSTGPVKVFGSGGGHQGVVYRI